MSAAVLFTTPVTADGHRLGLIRLNRPGSLNALDLSMVELMLEQLLQWRDDPVIVAVFIDAAGSKAFCAGGDVQSMYRSAVESPGGPCLYTEKFFEQEYRLDYLLHQFPKPVIGWGEGIVMGGGLGIFAACSQRVVTESSRIAMPEITIALYPDVGGSYFLNRMPGQCGLFLALTASSINAGDCLYAGLADYFIAASKRDALVEALLQLPWQEGGDIERLVAECCAAIAAGDQQSIPESQLAVHRDSIDRLCSGDKLAAIIAAFSAMESDDQWLLRARDGLLRGSPLAALWIFQQLQLCREMPLADVFRSEMQLSTNVVRYPEFAEGVRALMIDKDKNPRWQFASLAEVPEDLPESFFKSHWPENPLRDLA